MLFDDEVKFSFTGDVKVLGFTNEILVFAISWQLYNINLKCAWLILVKCLVRNIKSGVLMH